MVLAKASVTSKSMLSMIELLLLYTKAATMDYKNFSVYLDLSPNSICSLVLGWLDFG